MNQPWISLVLIAALPGFASVPARASPPPAAVYEISPAADAPVLGVTLLGNLVPYALADHLIRPRCPCDPMELNSLDRGVIGNHDTFADSPSDATAGVALGAPALIDLLELGSTATLRDDLIVYAETLSVAGALATLAKYSVQRPLPRVYAGQDPVLAQQPGGYRSFYSGHTTLTFAALSAASVTADLRYHAGIWPWLVTAAVGTSVALERVAAGRHFYTDVIFGAVTGIGIGVAVPLLHKKADGSPAGSGSGLSVGAAGAVPGALVSYRFGF